MPLPLVATFWRTSTAVRLVHYSPIMDIQGVGPDSYAIDILHTWALGPVTRIIAYIFWFVLDNNIWGQDLPYLGMDDCRQLGILRLRAEMWLYYRSRRQRDPDWKHKGSEVCTN